MASNDDHFSNRAISAEIAENLKEFFPEFVDLSYDEFLENQEGLYQSLNEFDRNKDTSVPTSDWSQLSGRVGESSRIGNSDSQIVLDEAFARSLLEEEFDELNISQPSRTETENRAGSSRETPVTTATQGDRDPDNMTYEQPLSLGESVGSASSGLSQARISKLPSSKYRSGWFSSKKKESPECAICCMPFRNGDTLITLRCSHQYHSECIKKWLQLKKHCPICEMEVF
ncbi:E3 ubiquitin ligase BIG BROTHER-related-like isoform X2 [Actinidia eriantha]|uniref:E3 ubiquitin ligase BIG BROTHER-related-like isoform X2 n=1 Tax=Actinidia eriantha TaxID=165200 RepID=UPI00258DCD40|nr:E3 ubiquitin ligase BIG BROTHER-related-like isoform X2 [Actinidia eriantha]